MVKVTIEGEILSQIEDFGDSNHELVLHSAFEGNTLTELMLQEKLFQDQRN